MRSRPYSIAAISLAIAALPLLSLLLLVGCGSRSEAGSIAGEITVFAATSLTDAFRELGEAFERDHPGTEVTFNFAGSSTLSTQTIQGAPADVLASADERQMERAVQAGVVESSPTPFATNRLVVVTPVGRDRVGSLGDLADPGVKVVLALPDVPVGTYSRQALRQMEASGQFSPGFADAVLANVVSEETNVRQVASKVALGEADAGIVYSTDVTPDIADSVNTIEIPEEFNVVARYPIATLTDAPNPAGASAFVSFVLSAEGQGILARHGFGSAAQ